jgi:hypothetical protein
MCSTNGSRGRSRIVLHTDAAEQHCKHVRHKPALALINIKADAGRSSSPSTSAMFRPETCSAVKELV